MASLDDTSPSHQFCLLASSRPRSFLLFFGESLRAASSVLAVIPHLSADSIPPRQPAVYTLAYEPAGLRARLGDLGWRTPALRLGARRHPRRQARGRRRDARRQLADAALALSPGPARRARGAAPGQTDRAPRRLVRPSRRPRPPPPRSPGPFPQ